MQRQVLGERERLVWSFSALFGILAYCVEKEKWRDELRCVVW